MKLSEAIHELEVRLAINESTGKKIAERIAAEFKRRIEGGEVKPALDPKYEARKVKQGFPKFPLYKTGGLANSLKYGGIENGKLIIVSDAAVDVFWHAGDKRAKGVPKRDPMTSEDISKIALECFIEQVNGGQ